MKNIIIFIYFNINSSVLDKQVARLKKIVTDDRFPTGIIHADLFPDNALFHGEDLQAIVDWEV